MGDEVSNEDVIGACTVVVVVAVVDDDDDKIIDCDIVEEFSPYASLSER